MKSASYDVIIVGGGIMGCSTAYNLLKRDITLRVAVVERDPTYARASTALSMANIRIQFSLKENIQISQYAFQVLGRFEEEMAVEGEGPCIAFHREGNLFLVDEAGRLLTPALESGLLAGITRGLVLELARAFVRAEVEDGRLLLSDLRMGQEPYYVFTHVVAEQGNPHWREIPSELLPFEYDRSLVFESLRRIWTH